ncbi:MAG: translocation/assembly module TamB [Chlamydiae bacterium]|nr:translocation/assembly module TamB [Chlamydiota bacterium]
MKNILQYFIKTLLLILLTFLVLLIGSFILLQTPWCKNQLCLFIHAKAKNAGLSIEISNLEGIPPFKWAIKTVTFHFQDGSTLHLEKVKIRIALFPLLRNQLTISFLNIQEGTYTYTKPKLTWDCLENLTFSFPKISSLPCAFASPHLLIRQLHFINNHTQERHSFSVYGDVHIEQDLTDMMMQLNVSQAGSSHVCSDISITGSEKSQWIDVQIGLQIPSTAFIDPLLTLPFEVDFALKSSFKGPWRSFTALIQDTGDLAPPIQIAMIAEAQHLNVPTLPILNNSWKTSGAFLLYPDSSIVCKKLSVQSSFLELISQFTLDPTQHLTKLDTIFAFSDLSLFSPITGVNLEGDMTGKLSWTPLKTLACMQYGKLSIEGFPMDHSKLLLQGSNDKEGWIGKLSGSIKASEMDTKIAGSITIGHKELSLHDFSLSALDARMDIEGSYYWKTPSMNMDIVLSIPSLRVLRPVLPTDSAIDGALGGTVHLRSDGPLNRDMPIPEISGHLFAKNVRYGNKLMGRAILDVRAKNLSDIPSTQISLELENVLMKNLFIEHGHLSTEENGRHHPFTFSMSGIWKEPLSIDIAGCWRKEGDAVEIECSQLDGKVLQKTVTIEQPFSLYKKGDRFSCHHFLAHIDDSLLFFDAQIDRLGARITTKAEHLPLDVLTISTPGVYLTGTTSFEGMLDMQADVNAGYFNATLEQARISEQGKTDSFSAKGSIQAHLYQDKLQLFSHVYATHGQFIDLTASIPILCTTKPFLLTLDRQSPMTSELICEGELETIFDFVNIGSQKAKGLISSHLFASGSLAHPHLLGTLDLQNGRYENYVSGTRLTKIEGSIRADHHELQLKNLSCQGGNAGTLTASGQMRLNQEENYPFLISAQLQDMPVINVEMIESRVSGEMTIEGDSQGGNIQGTLTAPQAIVSISETLPEAVPALNITYINRPIHLKESSLLMNKPYPLQYDVQLTAKDNVIVRGRGLNSEWKGNLHLLGNNTSVSGKGTLRLIKGDYTFSGKKFTLTQGEIDFTDKPSASAFLKILGTLHLPEMQVQVMMQGPLEAPTLTLQSTPYMPTSAILARILFNKDISEITAVQALQLANVVVSMSGAGGPDLLEAIRKSIGVDRLTIVGKEGSDEISLQIGWYLTHGVTVSLAQSATSSDVTVEVDLKHGFIFQAETQNQEEGKFSLKWNRNY